MEKKRVFLIVLDSYGIGEMTDAADFGDVGANTLKTITKVKEYDTPNMKRIGLFNIDGVDWMEKEEHPIGSYARMKEQSRGKDTTIGHWEIAGVISPNRFRRIRMDFRRKCWMRLSVRREGRFCATSRTPEQT